MSLWPYLNPVLNGKFGTKPMSRLPLLRHQSPAIARRFCDEPASEHQ